MGPYTPCDLGLVCSDKAETTVRLLWLSMLKMPPELLRLCACHLLTWFSIIAEAVFFTDFMGQVIYHGDPTVRDTFLTFSVALPHSTLWF